jgi:hypothetical protein
VYGRDREPAEIEVLGDPVGRPLGTGEDHCQAASPRLHDPGDDLDLVHRVGAVDELLGLRRRSGLGGVPRVDVHRLPEETPGQRDDRIRHGGREEHRLPVLRQHRQNLLDVVEEAQVEHPVRLVEDERVHPVQPEVLLLGQVQQPAGRTDQDLDALAERVDLRLVRDAAVDRQDSYATGLAGRGEILRYLQAQFPGRYDDECLRQAVAALAGREDPFEQRYAETERLAGTGGGLTDQVGAAHRDRHGVFLNGEGPGDADCGERGDSFLTCSQLREGGSLGSDRCVGGQRRAGHDFFDVIAHVVLGVPFRGAPRSSVGRCVGMARATRSTADRR